MKKKCGQYLITLWIQVLPKQLNAINKTTFYSKQKDLSFLRKSLGLVCNLQNLVTTFFLSFLSLENTLLQPQGKQPVLLSYGIFWTTITYLRKFTNYRKQLLKNKPPKIPTHKEKAPSVHKTNLSGIFSFFLIFRDQTLSVSFTDDDNKVLFMKSSISSI